MYPMRAARSPHPVTASSFAPRLWLKVLSRASPLAREITLVLVLKFVLLWLLWQACFSQPLATHMRLDPARVADRLLHTPPPQDAGSAQR
jgi:hypothetical protein